MGMYKVWSMSCNSEESDYYLEYEARVSASDESDAVSQVRHQFESSLRHESKLQESEEQMTPQNETEEWDWMAVKLP